MTIHCEECDVKIEDQSKLRLHEESVHVEMQCTPCGNSFNNICQLKEHVEIIHESCNTCMIKEELEDENTEVTDKHLDQAQEVKTEATDEKPEDAIDAIKTEAEKAVTGDKQSEGIVKNKKDAIEADETKNDIE